MLTVAHIWFSNVKHSKRRVLRCIIAFMQFKDIFGTCAKLIFYCKMHKTACYAVEYRICAISTQSWHLHKSDFSPQNTQKDVFCGAIFLSCNLKSELTVAQIGISTVKHSKRRFMRCIIAIVQFKVRVGTCTKLIFHCKMHKKTCFAMKYLICALSSHSCHLHKSDFPI